MSSETKRILGIKRDAVPKLARAFLAEFLATLVFVFLGPGSVSAGAFASGGDFFQPVGYSLAFGLSITALAFCIGDLSGGHINPAVTLTLTVTRNISLPRCVLYIIAQFLGGLCGGGLLYLAVGKEYYNSGIPAELLISEGGGFIMEFMGTAFLLFTVFCVAVWASKHSEETNSTLEVSTTAALAPIPIGFAVTIAHLVLGPFTGCGINPARVLGAVVYVEEASDRFPSHHWIYWVGPFTASLVVPLIYWLLYGSFHTSEVVHEHMAETKNYLQEGNVGEKRNSIAK